MSASVIVVFSLVVVLYLSQSARLNRVGITAPLVFTVAGTLAAVTTFDTRVDAGVVRALTETTLALVLFSDASRIRLAQLRLDAALCGRLLLIGLPLTLLLGFLSARALAPEISVALALLLASALAPTDAGLGSATVLNPAVPGRIQRLLNVESGLNDGLVTPVVVFAIAAAGQAGAEQPDAVSAALRELALGVGIGIASGIAVALLLRRARRQSTIRVALVPVAVVATPLLAYYCAVAAHGNGFVAAFMAGLAFASVRQPHHPTGPSLPVRTDDGDLVLAEGVSAFLGYAVWTLFGVVAVAHLDALFTWQGLLFSVLSLTVLRMLPVALALLGTGLRPVTVGFVGWFGPRGLASVVFALIAVESLPDTAGLRVVIGAITTTVILSVVLHGATAGPWAARYGRWVTRTKPPVELVGSDE